MAQIELFTFFIKSMVSCRRYKEDESPLIKILEADMGYCELQALCEILLDNPVTTASVERSFSTMNRILNKARIITIPETLTHCKIFKH